MNRSINWLLFLALLGLNAHAQAAHIGPTPVVHSGTAAPAGGNYSGFGTPVLNGSGQVAFTAGLTGGSSTRGLFAGAPGSLEAAALQGVAAPAGGNYNLFFNPVLNGSGQVAFLSFLTGGSSAQGIFAGAPGSVQVAALQGAAAPAGGIYGIFGSPVLNGSGQVAFGASLTGGSSHGGIFAGAPGSVQAAALQGAAAPAGANYDTLVKPVLNDSGQVAFLSTLTGGSSTEGIFAGTPGSVQAAVLSGTAAPVGGNYRGIGSPVLNGSGEVAFLSNLTGGSSGQGIFAGVPGSVQATALFRAAAPAGGNYNGFFNHVLNGSGQVAFTASLTGGSSTQGIFAGAPGSVQAIALQGAPSPDGVGNFNSLASFVALNASGQVAFTSSLAGAGVTAANDNGLYAGTAGAGNLFKIVREGDVIDVDPGALVDLRTVTAISFTPDSGGQDGRGMGLNDDGLLVYRLSFVDGSSGIFTSQITVPEPASLALLGGGAILLLARRGRYHR